MSDKKQKKNIGQYAILICILVSLSLHILSFLPLSILSKYKKSKIKPVDRPITVKIVAKPPVKKIEEKQPELKDEKLKKIIETPQEKTEAPKDAEHLSHQDHKAKEKMKIAKNKPRPKAADPGPKGNKTKKIVKKSNNKKKQNKSKQNKNQLDDSLNPMASEVKRLKYEKFLPLASNGSPNGGFFDYIEDETAKEGDRIDIDTKEYRFMGYFTNMRKAIELVWVYPQVAVQNLQQGTVRVEFVVKRDGTTKSIKVLKSSGYPVLDTSIAEAIKLAQPFGQLPANYKKPTLIVTANFRYILNGFVAH